MLLINVYFAGDIIMGGTFNCGNKAHILIMLWNYLQFISIYLNAFILLCPIFHVFFSSVSYVFLLDCLQVVCTV